MSFRFADRFFARWVAVSLARSRRGHTVPNYRLHRNQGRPCSNGLCIANGSLNRIEVISVFNRTRVPAVSLKTLWHTLTKSEICETFNGYLVIIIKVNNLSELEMT